jgi:hypothetical protein
VLPSGRSLRVTLGAAKGRSMKGAFAAVAMAGVSMGRGGPRMSDRNRLSVNCRFYIYVKNKYSIMRDNASSPRKRGSINDSKFE